MIFTKQINKIFIASMIGVNSMHGWCCGACYTVNEATEKAEEARRELVNQLGIVYDLTDFDAKDSNAKLKALMQEIPAKINKLNADLDQLHVEKRALESQLQLIETESRNNKEALQKWTDAFVGDIAGIGTLPNDANLAKTMIMGALEKTRADAAEEKARDQEEINRLRAELAARPTTPPAQAVT